MHPAYQRAGMKCACRTGRISRVPQVIVTSGMENVAHATIAPQRQRPECVLSGATCARSPRGIFETDQEQSHGQGDSNCCATQDPR
jgi:hypothetical protein